jgi:sugar lactone lactonase YvrE
MQVNLEKVSSAVRFCGIGTSMAVFLVLALCLCGAAAQGQLPIVVSGAPTQLGALTGGGWDGSQEPVGGTFVIGVNGNVLVGNGYGSNFLQITPSGSDTTLAAGVGGSAAALDSYGNLYFGGNYNANIFKVPYNAATGQYVGFTTAPTTNCLGGNQDTAPCVFAPSVVAYMNGTLAGSGASGYAGVAFDPQGNFFFESNTLPGTNPNSIFECNLACLASSTATPKLIYKDSNPIGAFQIDPWGNLFFVDGSDTKGQATNLNEIPLSSGSYATSPTVVLSYTNAAGYGNGISGLALAGNGTIYFSTDGDGLFAVPNTQSGGPKVSGIYMLSTQGGKGVAVDSKGNLYGIPYNNGDVVSFIPVGSFSLGSVAIGGTATTATVNVFDNAAACTPTLSESAFEFGKATTEFSVTPGTTCGAELGTGNGTFSPAVSLTGSMISATITFNPAGVGARNATLVVADSANSASGIAALTGVGQGAIGNLDPGVITAYGTGFTTPYSVSVDSAKDMAIADEGAGKVFWIPAGSAANTAPTAIGSGFVNPSATAFDADGNLYIADFSNDNVVEIPNVSGTLVPASQSTLISSTMVFNGTALSKPSGLAVGPKGTLYIADLGNSRVVSYNLITGQAAVPITGLKNPWQVAVDPSSNIYVANTGNGDVVVDIAGAQSTLTVPGVTAPWGIVLDPSGSLIVSDHSSGNIVRVPNLGGTLTVSSAVTIEKNPSSALAIALDAAGDLFAPDATGKTVYAIQRTAASVNLGTVQNGLTNSATVYLENAGNQTATLGSPVLTQPSNTNFALASGTTNGCSNAGSGPAGSYCAVTATFQPAVGTAAGPQTGSGTINVATPTLTLTVNMSGTASTSAVLPQTITGFNPPASLAVGQQITLSATGGASGNPVVFSVDPSSSCTSCAATSGTNGTTLTAVGAGKITVDANQAAGQANGNQYAAAKQIQASITINSATPTGVPALVMSQVTFLNPTGSFTDGQNPAGGSFAVTQNGEIVVGTTYSNKVYVVNAQTGATIGTPVTFNGPGGMTVDSKNNLYLSHLYNSVIYKVPYVNGAYVSWSDNPTPAPPACTGSDTAECTFVTYPSGAPNSGGIKAIAFDPSGNFYMVSEPDSKNTLTGQSNIYECAGSCLPAGTGKLLYADNNGVSQIAFDPWGNLFFTDANYNEAGTNNESNSGAASSGLYEIPASALSTMPITVSPTPLQTFTNTGTPGSYDDMLASVAVSPTGTIYYGVLYDGMFAIPNTQTGGPLVANQYAVSSQGAKALTADSLGNLYLVANTSGADTVGFLAIDNLNAGTGPVLGTPVTASATLVDNAIGCGTAATLTFTSSNPEFSATAGTQCSSIGMGDATLLNAVPGISSYPMTITFGPTTGGPQTATLAASDTANGGTGTANLSGTGQEVAQTITITGPTTTTYTYAPGLTITMSATGGGSKNPIIYTVDASSTGTGTFSGNVLTVTQAGSIVVDANEAGGLVNNVYYQNATQAQSTLTINLGAQAIVFPQPNSPVTFGANPSTTVTLSANGGGSGNPVVFSVDSSSTGAGTVSTSTVANGTSTATLTVTGAGNIVVDANQAANVDYAAATQVQQTIVVNQATQTIAITPLSQPFYYIATGATLNISAVGGGSDNPIVFTVDPKSTMTGSFSKSTVSGATSTATLTMPANETPTTGTIIVDANQPGNANYLAATQAQMTITVGTPLPTQTITFGQPQTQVVGTPLTLTATATSGFPVTFTSSTASVCTVSGSTATFIAAGPCTITASQAGDNQFFAAAPPVTVTFAVNASGQTPGMTASLSLPALTIQTGTVGVTTITINSLNGFAAGQITFACSGFPIGWGCSFNPSTLTSLAPASTTGLPGATSGTTTLTVTPPQQSYAMQRRDVRPLFPVTFAVALCFLGFKKRSRLFLILMVVAIFAGFGMLSGCGGSSSTTTAPTTAQGTVTVSGGGMQTTATLTVTAD